MTDYTKGGRGKKAPYETTLARIPVALAPTVKKISDEYKKQLEELEVSHQLDFPTELKERCNFTMRITSELKNAFFEYAKQQGKTATELITSYMEECLAENPVSPSNIDYYEFGLTKREYFAAMALQGLLANEYLSSTDRVEAHAVEHADRLIEALNKEE